MAVLDTGRDCRSDCGNQSLMPDATSLIIASRFKGPPDSGNGGYVCGAFAVAAGTELRDASDSPIGQIDCAETTGYAPDEASGIVVACNRVIVVDALWV